MTRAERLRLEAAEREAMRLRGWLGFVSWRARVVGKVRATDADVAPAIAAAYPAWPEKSTRDQRDAAGVLAFDVMPPRAKPKRRAGPKRERARPRRDPGERNRKFEPAYIAQRAAFIAYRAEHGCTCGPTGRHRRGCPLKGLQGAQT